MTCTSSPTVPVEPAAPPVTFTLERAQQLFPGEAFDGTSLTVHVPAAQVDALRDAHERAQPEPGETWTSLHYGWTARITASGDFELVQPPMHAGVVLGPRRHWDRQELRDWIRLPPLPHGSGSVPAPAPPYGGTGDPPPRRAKGRRRTRAQQVRRRDRT